jgi:hypothetical protein
LAEELRFNDAIQLLEAPVPFPIPRPRYAVSVGLSGSANILLKDLGRADEIDAIGALLTICKNISQKIVNHIDQREFFIFFNN